MLAPELRWRSPCREPRGNRLPIECESSSQWKSVYPHGKTSQAKLPDSSPVGRNELRIGKPCIGEPRQQTADGDHERRAAENIADAVVGSCAKGHYALWI